MKINRIFVLGLCLMAMSMGLAIENLPKIEIEGKTYYYYDVKKDDSLYGIAKQFGWDMQTIIAANPNSSTNLKKGQRIYYPIADQMQSAKTVAKEQSLDEVCHKVKHGETVYSISLMYGLKQEDIYELNPSSRYGIKAGEQLVVQKAVTISNDSDDVSNVYYTVQSEDSLLGVAESYDTSVEDILRLNPGLSESSFNEGDIVKLQPNSDKNETEIRNIEKRQVEHFEPYRINKGDTWTSISQQFNITTEELKEANDGIVELKRGRYLSIPVYETVVSEEKYVVEDPREQTIEGRQELYDEIQWGKEEIISYYGRDLMPAYIPDGLFSANGNGTGRVIVEKSGKIVEDTIWLSFYHSYYEDGSPMLTEDVAATKGFTIKASKIGIINDCLYILPENEVKTSDIGGIDVTFGYRSMEYGPYDPETHVPSGYYDLYVAEFVQDGIEYYIVADQIEIEELVKVVASIIYGEKVILQ